MENSVSSAPKWPYFTALALLALAIIFGIFSYPQHPLRQGNIPEIGGGYDYFHSYAIVNALNDKVSNVYSSQELLDYSRKLSGQHNWAINDNHLLPFYLLYNPLAHRDFNSGYYIHLWANLHLMWLALIALCLSVLPTRRQAYTVLVLLVLGTLTMGPAVDNIWLGQISFGLAGILAILFLCERAEYHKAAGICLALAILLKMYPALLLILFALRKRWKLLQWTAGTLVALGIVAGLQWGFGHYANYLDFLGNTMSYNKNIANQSFIGVIAASSPYLASDELKIVNICLMALATGGLVWFSWKRPDRPGNFSVSLLEFSLWITVANIISPLSWGHHHVYLALPLLAFLGVAISPAGPESRTATPVDGSDERDFWSAPLNIDSTTRLLALGGLALIVLLWCCEGETATNPAVQSFHYSICANHLGLVGLLGIVALEAACALRIDKK